MDAARVSLHVDEADAGRRLDRFVSARLDGLSRTRIQALNAAGGITVGGRRRPDSYSLTPGETVEVDAAALAALVAPAARVPAAQPIPLSVVYEDASLVVVNKPAGLVVHPAHGNWEGTLVNALLGRGTPLAALGGADRPGVVHRLDKGTSGLIVLAKTDAAYRSLAAQFKEKQTEKTYHAIVHGHVRARSIVVDEPIGRHPTHRQRMTVAAVRGRAARTDVFVVDTYQRFDYIRVSTQTGRTHQIRVHMAHVGNPLLGDPVYGGRRQRTPAAPARVRTTFERLMKLVPRHALHASRLSFIHPDLQHRLTLTTALPTDMRLALETLYREDRAREVAV